MTLLEYMKARRERAQQLLEANPIVTLKLLEELIKFAENLEKKE